MTKPIAAVSRRAALRGAAASALTLAFPSGAHAATASEAGAGGRDVPERLVVVWLRGGADGLSLVAPFADPAYVALRPTLAIGAPGSGAHAGLPLDGHFALHPALALLYPLWQQKRLAIVPALGAAALPRSHLLAERRIARWLDAAAKARGLATPVERRGEDGAPLAAQCATLATEVTNGSAPRVVTLLHDGWDTHVAQGAARLGRLADAAAELAAALARFTATLGSALDHVTVLVLSEHGRSVAENDRGGTDDGAASVGFVLGGAVDGGRVIGDWPGLAAGARVRGGLRPTTDHRDLFAHLLPHPTSPRVPTSSAGTARLRARNGAAT